MRDDLDYPCRWVLGDEPEVYLYDHETGDLIRPIRKHCDACLKFAGEYENYQAMLAKTNEAVPSYFPGYADLGEPESSDPVLFAQGHYEGKACFLMCSCHLELKIDGQWQRI